MQSGNIIKSQTEQINQQSHWAFDKKWTILQEYLHFASATPSIQAPLADGLDLLE